MGRGHTVCHCWSCSIYKSTAFDDVEHDILLCKLKEKLGLTGTAIRWFPSYLWLREQTACEVIESYFPTYADDTTVYLI